MRSSLSCIKLFLFYSCCFICPIAHGNNWSWDLWDIESQSSGSIIEFTDTRPNQRRPPPVDPNYCHRVSQPLSTQANVGQGVTPNNNACGCCATTPATINSETSNSETLGLWGRYNRFIHGSEHNLNTINPILSGIVPATQQYVEGALLFSGGQINPTSWGVGSHLAGLGHMFEHQFWHAVEHRLIGGDGAGGALLRFTVINRLLNYCNCGTYSIGRAALIVGALDFTVDAGIALGGQGAAGLQQRFNTLYGHNIAHWSAVGRGFGLLLDDAPMSIVSFGIHILTHGAAIAMVVGAEKLASQLSTRSMPPWAIMIIANGLNALISQAIVADLSTRSLAAIPGNLINPGAGTAFIETPFIYLYPILLLSHLFR